MPLGVEKYNKGGVKTPESVLMGSPKSGATFRAIFLTLRTMQYRKATPPANVPA
jgi:hypothetical protein